MKSKKILIVDDDYEVRESCQLVLADDGYITVGAANGAEAITKYFEFRPDIVFMDIRMPGIDGYDTFLSIQKRDCNARVVLTSSYALDDEKYKYAKKRSLAGLINKPINWPDLERMIIRHAK